jgi:hypothetical protein
VIFAFNFQTAVKAKDMWGHFDGPVAKPMFASPMSAEETDEHNKWHKNEGILKHLLTQHIINETLGIRITGSCGSKTSGKTVEGTMLRVTDIKEVPDVLLPGCRTSFIVFGIFDTQ